MHIFIKCRTNQNARGVLTELKALTENEIKHRLNTMLTLFKKEYQDQDVYYNMLHGETRGVLQEVENMYPFISWLNYFKINIFERWSTSVDKTEIEFMLDINNQTPRNASIHKTRMDDLIEELNSYGECDSKEALISVYMAIKGCHPRESRSSSSRSSRSSGSSGSSRLVGAKNQKTPPKKVNHYSIIPLYSIFPLFRYTPFNLSFNSLFCLISALINISFFSIIDSYPNRISVILSCISCSGANAFFL
jgi:hypothetical protein